MLINGIGNETRFGGFFVAQTFLDWRCFQLIADPFSLWHERKLAHVALGVASFDATKATHDLQNQQTSHSLA